MTVVRLSSVELQINVVKLFWIRLNVGLVLFVLLDATIAYILLSTENLSQAKEMRYLEEFVTALLISVVTSAKPVKILACLSNLRIV
jgi:hypothetical protein